MFLLVSSWSVNVKGRKYVCVPETGIQRRPSEKQLCVLKIVKCSTATILDTVNP